MHILVQSIDFRNFITALLVLLHRHIHTILRFIQWKHIRIPIRAYANFKINHNGSSTFRPKKYTICLRLIVVLTFRSILFKSKMSR